MESKKASMNPSQWRTYPWAMISRKILTLQSGYSTLPLGKEILTLSLGIPSFNLTIRESNPTIMKGKLSIVIKNFHSTLQKKKKSNSTIKK